MPPRRKQPMRKAVTTEKNPSSQSPIDLTTTEPTQIKEGQGSSVTGEKKRKADSDDSPDGMSKRASNETQSKRSKPQAAQTVEERETIISQKLEEIKERESQHFNSYQPSQDVDFSNEYLSDLDKNKHTADNWLAFKYMKFEGYVLWSARVLDRAIFGKGKDQNLVEKIVFMETEIQKVEGQEDLPEIEGDFPLFLKKFHQRLESEYLSMVTIDDVNTILVSLDEELQEYNQRTKSNYQRTSFLIYSVEKMEKVYKFFQYLLLTALTRNGEDHTSDFEKDFIDGGQLEKYLKIAREAVEEEDRVRSKSPLYNDYNEIEAITHASNELIDNVNTTGKLTVSLPDQNSDSNASGSQEEDEIRQARTTDINIGHQNQEQEETIQVLYDNDDDLEYVDNVGGGKAQLIQDSNVGGEGNDIREGRQSIEVNIDGGKGKNVSEGHQNIGDDVDGGKRDNIQERQVDTDEEEGPEDSLVTEGRISGSTTRSRALSQVSENATHFYTYSKEDYQVVESVRGTSFTLELLGDARCGKCSKGEIRCFVEVSKNVEVNKKSKENPGSDKSSIKQILRCAECIKSNISSGICIFNLRPFLDEADKFDCEDGKRLVARTVKARNKAMQKLDAASGSNSPMVSRTASVVVQQQGESSSLTAPRRSSNTSVNVVRDRLEGGWIPVAAFDELINGLKLISELYYIPKGLEERGVDPTIIRHLNLLIEQSEERRKKDARNLSN